jgi:murein DD-endopeptidase MepM/ murein hydrolase activator NlpD
MKTLFLLLLFISSVFAFKVDMSDTDISNGRTLFVEFKKDKNTKYEKVVLGKKSYKIFNNPLDSTKMYALVPISYYQKPSTKKVKIVYKKKNSEVTKSMFIHIKDGKYKKETIHVDNSKVHPNKKDQKRAQKEYAEAMNVYNTVTNKSYFDSKFILPMDSNITSSFGKARVYNDTLKGYHSGTDFRAKVGTPIHASNDGVVALVKDRFYSGGSVVIDHGEGIYTCYFHMSKFNVKKGQKVKKGTLIGLSGKSGRVTGPHLHFAARVGGVQVDPLQLIALLNKNLFKAKQ